MESPYVPDDQLRAMITEGDDLLEAAFECRGNTDQARHRDVERRLQLQAEQIRLADIAWMLGGTEMNRLDQRLVGDVDDEVARDRRCSAPYPSAHHRDA
jgi:hypothetical protein